MAKITKSDKLAAALVKLGHEEIPSKSGKYRTFKRDGLITLYFVGKNGALRSGPSASRSYSLVEDHKTMLLVRAGIK